jgi:hypothetical protein
VGELLVVIFVALLFIGFILSVALVGARSTKETEAVRREIRKVEVVATRAIAAVERLIDDRRLIERKAVELERLSRELRGDAGFQVLVQRHNESRSLADSWYDHRKQAINSRTVLARGVAMLQWRIGRLRAEGRRLSMLVTTTQASADQLGSVVSELQREITLSGAALDRYNLQMGELSRHIGVSCGPRGEQWYAALQERKRPRELNRQRR